MHAWVQAEGRQLFIVKGQQLMKRSFEPPVAVHPTNHGSVSMHAHAQQEGRDPRNVVMGKVKYGRKRTGLKESKRERERRRGLQPRRLVDSERRQGKRGVTKKEWKNTRVKLKDRGG